MNDRIDAVLVDTSVYHKRQCDFEGITNSIIPMLLQLLRAIALRTRNTTCIPTTMPIEYKSPVRICGVSSI